MKKLLVTSLLFVFVLLLAAVSTAQHGYLASNEKRVQFYAHLQGKTAIIYSLGRWIDIGGSAYTISRTDTLQFESGWGTDLYSNQSVRLEQNGLIWKLSIPRGRKEKVKSFSLNPATDTSTINEQLNNGYWSDQYLKMTKIIAASTPDASPGFRGVFGSWKQLENKQLPHAEFRVFTDNKIKALTDSFQTAYHFHETRMNSIISKLPTISYEELADSVQKLFIANSYFDLHGREVVKQIAIQRPDLYFKLAENLPALKSDLFYIVSDKKAVQSLKLYQTDSRVKKEFIKEKRSDKWFTVKVITAATAGAALLVVSAIALF